jgi:NAD(P)-dependent dehydrogenase (short-subunit alcohol dehydrogenase family)
MTLALNHLGYFLLTNLLLEPLKAAPAARIVNVSSQTHRYARMGFDDLGMEKGFSPLTSYAQSKLANILFTYELARRLDGTNITVNAMHPGAVRTDLSRELTGVVGSVYRKFGFLMRTPEKGAETVIWLATSEEAAGETGKYFFDTKEIRSSRYSYDADMSRRLWNVSVELTGLSD